MSKVSKEELARLSGCQWMLKKVKEVGLEEAEQELEWRCNYKIPIGQSKADLNRFSDLVKDRCIGAFTMIAVATLRDLFGFGHDRLTRFKNVFENKCDCLSMDYCSFEDYQEALNEEVGVNIEVDDACKKATKLETNSIGVIKKD